MTALLDRVTRVTPLGVRCRDDATGQPVRDGLVLRLVDDRPRAVATRPTPRGVFTFPTPPGLASATHGTGDAAYWGAVTPRSVTIEIDDRFGRYLPVRLAVTAPTRGLALPECLLGSPPDSPPDRPSAAIPLFSAPARPIPPGLAAVRGSLRDADDQPVAFALLEVVHVATGRVIGRGVADDEGRVVAPVAYPEPAPAPGSPPQPQPALTELAWPVEVRVFAGVAAGEVPDLCALLAQRPAAALATLSPPVPLPTQTLSYGADLVVRSAGRADLVITPL